MAILAFKDADDGYYECEVADGEALPAWTKNLTPTEVAKPATSAAELAEQRRAAITAELAAVDAASARPLRAILAAQAAAKTADAADLTKLAELEAQAVALRTELAALQGA